MRWMETIRISASQHAREEHNQLISSIHTQANNQINSDGEQQQHDLSGGDIELPVSANLERQATTDIDENHGNAEDTVANYHTEHLLASPRVDHQKTNHYTPSAAEVYS